MCGIPGLGAGGPGAATGSPAVPGASVTIANRGQRSNRFLDQVKQFGQGFFDYQQNQQPQVTGPSYALQPQQMNDPQDPGALLRSQILAQLLGVQGY